MRKILLIILVFSILGCSSGKEFYRKMAGTSTRALEYYEPRYTQSFDIDYSEAFYKIVDFLKNKLEVTVMREDYIEGRILAVHFDKLYSCIDTTDVGIFVLEPAEGRVVIEVASFNSSLARFAADKIFQELQKQ